MTVPKFRKKPITVEAVPFEMGMEDGIDRMNWLHRKRVGDKLWKTVNYWYTFLGTVCANSVPVPYINTLEGKYYVKPDDYIITGIKGERYPCRKDIFEETYERVEE